MVAALRHGLEAVDANSTDFALLTTPQLHYVARCINTKDTQMEYGEPTEQGYNEKLTAALKTAMMHKTSTGSVTVDCANGIGGPKLRSILETIPSASNGGIDISVVNDNVQNTDVLNVQVSLEVSQ